MVFLLLMEDWVCGWYCHDALGRSVHAPRPSQVVIVFGYLGQSKLTFFGSLSLFADALSVKIPSHLEAEEVKFKGPSGFW